MKKIWILKLILIVFIWGLFSLNTAKCEDKDITEAISIIFNYQEGEAVTAEIQNAARIIKTYYSNPTNLQEENLLAKANSICTTTFCGKGLREGLNLVKPNIKGTGITTSDSIIVVILGLIDFALPFAGLFAFVGSIYGGFLYITSFAEDQTEKARNILMWSALGLVIIFIAYPFVATLIKFQITK